ncbi:unnamed protein product [Penicillium nalgiovense]|uniref:VLRF1 domain-containing protein n=1 Tax=Penicillium nalgiovense TaxID=60175 RepID=A0A9W4HVE4_PENNA|nr:unnamed protein product [Penicillium nalgiovense]CAG7965037.1 unnamed protein product [Penicillium nalgiovense]CAG8044488.1 unnamed protein product [Penicillium nalgiovense]CAG8064366.1 unnamed protein product [Penicillium nalgiovense]CAG8073045.1 unnamed protein product [Penicillium nalgiovense]
MVDTTQMEELLKRPLYVYDLPPELLASLTAKTTSQPIAEQEPEPSTKDLELAAQDSAIATSTLCSLCRVSYNSVQEQRSHVRSDHHRYNIKAQLRGNAPLEEIEFAKAIGELDESISGSESSGTEEEDSEVAAGTALSALLKKQAKLSHPNEDPEMTETPITPKHPIFWLSSSGLPSNKSLGVYRAIFSNEEQDEPAHLVDTLRRKQLAPIKARTNKASNVQDPAALGPHIFMCMIGGGHFAAMLVSLAPEIHRKQGGVEDRQARVIAHKTFHRYTTRRKQGGSQSASDASRGAAHSAGSSLRRYNEAALEKDIREVLSDWKEMIDTAELLFVRATGKTNRKTLFGQYDGQVLRQNDPRLRGFPFNTRRATQGELMRSFKELTRMKVSEVDEAALAAAEAKRRDEESKPSTPVPKPQPQKPKLSKEEEAALLHTSQLQALIRRSKVPALMSYISSNSIPSSFTFTPADSPQNFRCPTPLHLAANLNAPAVVTALLTKAGSDPTAVNNEGRTPFELTGDRPTRDAFRVARHDLGESKWDWEAAKVPSAVSKADAESRAEKERKAAEEEEAARRKASLDRLKREEAEKAAQPRTTKSGGRTVGAVEKSAAERRDEETRGMTPEMKMRLERERRARAAEERFKRMQGQ